MKYTFSFKKMNDRYQLNIHRCEKLPEMDRWYTFGFTSDEIQSLRDIIGCKDSCCPYINRILFLEGNVEKLMVWKKKVCGDGPFHDYSV